VQAHNSSKFPLMLNFDFKIILAKMTMFWIISFQFPFNVQILLLGSSTWETHVPLFHSLVATCGTLCKWLLVCPQLDGPPLLAMVELHHPLSDVLLWTLLSGSFEKLDQKISSKGCVDYGFYITFSSFDLGRVMFPIQTCRWMFHGHVLCKDACETMIGQIKM
jgi:hypothetical protein